MAGVSNGWERLGRMIKAERSHRWRFQYEFHQATGLSTRTLSALENGRQSHPHDETLIAIEDALGWLPGSCRHVVAGGKPLLEDDPERAELVAAWALLSDDNKAWILAEVRRLAQV